MSFIDLTRQHVCLSSLLRQYQCEQIFPNAHHQEIVPKRIIASIILTESIASNLNLPTYHLQDLKGNTDKSKICVCLPDLDENDVKVAYLRSTPLEEKSSTSLVDAEEDVETAPKIDVFPKLFPYVVQTLPLMTVRSEAHNGNLVAESEHIFVHVHSTDLPITSSGWVNMCRICHGGESYEDLIGPCRCRGSVALAHLSCLERWLRESAKSHCELCQQHYEITRKPKYGVLKSILIWLCSSGDHTAIVIDDFISFCLYTPAAVCTTYILMLICECASSAAVDIKKNPTGHVVAFFAIAGIAAIDFTYSSWLLFHMHRHVVAWRSWYRENCCLTLVLPPRKRRRRRGKAQVTDSESINE